MGEESRSFEREADYYRRYCNELGASLFRLQEEQSQAFRSARRSRTVVKLLREAYRLGDVAMSTHDVGGPMLELLVENTLCDRAMLLREESVGSGVFLVAQAIGLANRALGGPIVVPSAPAFLYTTAAQTTPNPSAEAVVAGLGVSFVLWAYDGSTGHALVIGNSLESNLSRPFEAGDQELIEAALSIYLDVLYRKTAEAELRQAKQVAEAAGVARAAGLAALADELREPLSAIADLAETLRSRGHLARLQPPTSEADARAGDADNFDAAEEIVTLSRYLKMLVEGAAEQPEALASALSLDVEWVPIDELLRPAIAAVRAASVTHGVDVDQVLPRRRTAVLVDRRRMQHVLQYLLASVMRGSPSGGRLRMAASRLSDGGLEVVMTAIANPMNGGEATMSRRTLILDVPDGPNIAIPRAITRAHGGTLSLDVSPAGRLVARVVLPARSTRDFELSEEISSAFGS